VLRLVDLLTTTWTDQADQDSSILDEKLASYVFFPISHLLLKQLVYPVRVIEALIRLIAALVQHGWKSKITPELAQQLLVFLSLTVAGSSTAQPKQRDFPEETILEGYRALTVLVKAVCASSALAPSSPAGDQLIPPLGHSVTVMFDGYSESVPPHIQLEALNCVQTVFTVAKDNALLAQFLPGTVSSLTKLLSPPVQQKTQRRVLVAALSTLQAVLVNVLGDLKIRGVLKQRELAMAEKLVLKEPKSTVSEDAKARVDLTPSWLTATASQVKIALSSVLRLRNHEFEDVQQALDKVCISLLDECHQSLAECQPILVETAMMLEGEESSQSTLQTSLHDLVALYPELGESVKSALYGWVSSLPRVMQSNEDRIKQLAVRSILRGSKHAASLQLDSSTLRDSLGDALRDSLIALVKGTKSSKVQESASADLTLVSGSIVSESSLGMEAFNPVLLGLEGQKATRGEFVTLVSNIGSMAQQISLASTMLTNVRDSEGVDQIASYWLAFELLKASYDRSSALDDLLDLSALDENRDQEAAFHELYDFSVTTLVSHSESLEVDWRLEAIALEVTAFTATRMKTDFRPELIDVLYPVATFLGSPNTQLRNHAIMTLNILTTSCGYRDVSELIVGNADYMVNSVALRLNTFDISPASTKVLTMMVHLTGPKLIPYLDDVVAAIFAALDNYHGYPLLVESLFSVLLELVTQGAKSDVLLLEDEGLKTITHLKKRPAPVGIGGILDNLDKSLERKKRARVEERGEPTKPHPKKPWGPGKSETKSLLDKLANPEEEDDDGEPPAAVEEAKKPATPTYSLLTRVLSLTQHYLTSPTPTLRKSLLDLVATVSPALAPDENAFLPLVNDVWPVVVSRLNDTEPFVAIAACKALSVLCVSAGDFLSSRFKTEWSSGLAKWLRRTRLEALKARGGVGKSVIASQFPGQGPGGDILIPGRLGNGDDAGGLVIRNSTTMTPTPTSSPGGLGRFAQASQIWDAAVELLGAILGNVNVDDDMFDEILDMVIDIVPRNKTIREALQAVNADAVWLALYKRGTAETGPVPIMEGVDFARIVAAGG